MKFRTTNEGTFSHDKDGNEIQLSNFTAEIAEELKFVDGRKTDRHYLINANVGETRLPPIAIQANDFAALSWVQQAWGSQAIIFPRPNAKDLLRTIIQLNSKPKITTIYTHTGWTKIGKKHAYLAGNAAITATKRDDKVRIDLPHDLETYQLPTTTDQTAIQRAFAATMELTKLLPSEVAWALIGSIFRAPLGKSDFALHITGRTGTFKSEIGSIVQSYYGETNARNLPASWSSTANALEALCYRCKDAIVVVDDFIPMGTSWQQKTYQKTADQLIRGQGNQAGRARLTDTSNLQQTMYPRGLIISTGEDTPEGHSVRARMVIAELSPGEIAPKSLTTAQANRNLYAHLTAAYIQWIAADLDQRQSETKTVAERIRDDNLQVGHSRTPNAIGHLSAGIYMLLRFASETNLISPNGVNSLYKSAIDAITSLGKRQIEYLSAADPAEQFVQTLRAIFAANAGHAKNKEGGIPRKAMVLGWTNVGDPADMEFKPHGPRLGWADSREAILYLDANLAYETIRRHSRGSITITKQTLYRRLHEAGLLAKRDETRQRNTVRVQCEGAGRSCIALSLEPFTEGENHGQKETE